MNSCAKKFHMTSTHVHIHDVQAKNILYSLHLLDGELEKLQVRIL